MKKAKYTIVAGALVAIIGVGGITPAGATSITRLESLNRDMVQDMQEISENAGSMNVEGLATACDSLETHSVIALTFTRPKPIPKASWQHMRAAWHKFQSSASMCADGARGMNVAQLSRSIQLMGEGSTEIQRANNLLK